MVEKKVEVVQNGQDLKGAEALVAQGHAIVRLENDTQMQIAVQRPRDEAKILASAIKEVEIYPSLAEEAIYARPVGKDESGKQKVVEGLSIRAAESLANRWGNSAYGVDIVSDDGEVVTLAAVFLDYENNTRHVIQRRVSRYYKAKNGQIVQYSPDRFEIKVAAEASKALREVILRSLPAGLKAEYEKAIRAVLSKKDIRKRRRLAVEAFEKIGVSKETLEKKLGPPSKWTHDMLDELQGLYNAIKAGDIDPEVVFAEEVKTETKKEEPPKSAPDNLFNK